MAQVLDIHDPEHLEPLAQSDHWCADTDPALEGEGSGDLKDNGNHATLFHNIDITEDTIWRGEIQVKGSVSVAPQATLTIEGGSRVFFRADDGEGSMGSLVIQGRILVKGSEADPVSFAPVKEGQKCNWQGIAFRGSDKRNHLQNCNIVGAETGIDAAFSTLEMKDVTLRGCRTGARLQESMAVIDRLRAEECGTGLVLRQCEVEMIHSRFIGNRLGLFTAGTSLAMSGTTLNGNNLAGLFSRESILSLNGNSFTANGNGITLSSSRGEVNSNCISRNAIYGLVLHRSRVKVKDNAVEENGRIGLRVEDGMGVAWGNILAGNGEYDLYNNGHDDFRAVGNWWGTDSPKEASTRIYDGNSEDRGKVLYLPIMRKRPELSTSISIKPLSR